MPEEILYTSAAVHRAIKTVLGEPSRDEKRVALVAYVGEDAEAFLLYPRALTLICCLQPGATSARALENLRKRGAKILKSNKLHMKVYWSNKKGCVICSANASTNALGRGGLKEAGVFLSPGLVDIGKLINGALASRIEKADLKQLQKLSNRIGARQTFRGFVQEPMQSYVDWYKSTIREEWKMDWWDTLGKISKSARVACTEATGRSEPYYCANYLAGQISKHEWLLSFRLPKGTQPQWMWVDRTVKVARTDPVSRDGYTWQALQFEEPKLYATPPFKIDQKFRLALQKAIAKFGRERIERSKLLEPTKDFLKAIAAEYSLDNPRRGRRKTA